MRSAAARTSNRAKTPRPPRRAEGGIRGKRGFRPKDRVGCAKATSAEVAAILDPCPCGSGLKYKKCCGKNQ
ncbi:MAG: SEC-C domain-containing protein [Clostridia bacterium]|nr:SEC-C domain-containing protein [Clostridia bacterium]MBQ3091659.1 SEC-C domain-containing protein [Clostridia bacterium]MBQ9925674.1 SEC-C domain-containing protein [Clostridia bacterium]